MGVSLYSRGGYCVALIREEGDQREKKVATAASMNFAGLST